jgi:hypothetical protein
MYVILGNIKYLPHMTKFDGDHLNTKCSSIQICFRYIIVFIWNVSVGGKFKTEHGIILKT